MAVAEVPLTGNNILCIIFIISGFTIATFVPFVCPASTQQVRVYGLGPSLNP
jgi:hypothetical protein